MAFFRPEIEGLRAVAVLLVVGDHLLGWPAGGFVGVDIFFVISGYLITSLLLREHRRTGRISFRSFYLRRARRILPASLVTLGATLVVSRLLFYAARADQVEQDTVWSLAFLANIHFARVGTDYFQSDRPPSPVQHFWSLAVEEQFYLVWPLVLLVVLSLSHLVRRPSSGRTAALVVAGVAVAVSLYASIVQTGQNPTAAYFATPARAWELGVGAMLAIAAPWLTRMPAGLRTGLGLVGLVGVLGSAFLIDAQSRFPGPAAALPVGAAALILLCGTETSVAGGMWLLTNPVSRYVGRVSYSLYLWHWPVIVLLAAMLEQGSVLYLLIAGVAMTGLTILSYHFVEEPMRHARWRRSRRRVASPRQQERHHAAIAGLVAAAIVLTLWVARPTPPAPVFQAAPVGTTSAEPKDANLAPAPRELSADIESALASQSWPELEPPLDEIDADKPPEWEPCGNVNAPQLPECTFESSTSAAKHSAVVLGDSIGISWLPGIREALVDRGYTVYGMTFGQCPAADVAVDAETADTPEFTERCLDHRRWAFDRIAELKPDLVILSSAENSLGRLSSGATGLAAQTQWQQGIHDTLTKLGAAKAGEIVVLAPPPATTGLQQCATRLSRPADCVRRISSEWHHQSIAEAKAVAAADESTRYVNTSSWFCNATAWCPSFIDAMPVRFDAGHITATYSRSLGRCSRESCLRRRNASTQRPVLDPGATHGCSVATSTPRSAPALHHPPG